MSENKRDKHRGVENTDYARAMAELRRSNASGTHADRRDRRARTRDAQLKRDLRDQQ